jgi:hypothetical protein
MDNFEKVEVNFLQVILSFHNEFKTRKNSLEIITTIDENDSRHFLHQTVALVTIEANVRYRMMANK